MKAASGVAPQTIRVLPLTLSPALPGTLSSLAKDGDIFWTHTDGGTATPDWVVRLAKLKITPSGAEVAEIIPIVDETGKTVTGDLLDPEDIAVAPDGTLWLVDEIYPLIVQLNKEGQILKRVFPPAKYAQRVPGRGFEGCTISPDGKTLYVALQTGLSTQTDKSLTWLLAYDIAKGTFKEYPYQLEKPANYNYPSGVSAWVGTNGLECIGPAELLVIERDNLSGSSARVKQIFRVTIPDQPSDTPLAKERVLDLCSLGYAQEKVESIAIPDPNTMVLMNDNDGDLNLATTIWYMQF